MTEREVIKELENILVWIRNEKSKEAIEKIINLNNENKEWVTNLSKEVDRCHNIITGLNRTIEKQQAEIEELNKENDRQHELLCNIRNKNEQEKVDLRLQHIADIQKKDKIINAIVFTYKEDLGGSTSKNSIKKTIDYFTKEVEVKENEQRNNT